MKARSIQHAALVLAAALAAAAFPAAAARSSASTSVSSSNGAPARFSETIGISTPQKRVVGTLQGTGAAAGADDQLLDKVVDALVRDPGTAGANIEVRVDSGDVTLDGKVKDSAQAEHALQVAQNAAGNDHVTSNLSTSG